MRLLRALRGNWRAHHYRAENPHGNSEQGVFVYCTKRELAFRIGTHNMDLSRFGALPSYSDSANVGQAERKNAIFDVSVERTVARYFPSLETFIPVHEFNEFRIRRLPRNKQEYMEELVRVAIPGAEDVLAECRVKNADRDLAVESLFEVVTQLHFDLSLEYVSLPLPKEVKTPKKDELFAVPSEKAQTIVTGLSASLQKRVIGQNEAIATIVRAVKRSAAGLKDDPEAPIGTFLFAGRSGMGKTELAKALAYTLYPNEPSRFIRIDCSEYALPHEHAKLIGAPPGFVGHSEGGCLTEPVREKPDCVVLLDEIEKAHPRVHNLLLQVLGEGRLADGTGETVSFARAVVIMTSNLGIQDLDAVRARMGFRSGAQVSTAIADERDILLATLKRTFRPEFINRINDVVAFNDLTLEDCTVIARGMLRDVSALVESSGNRLSFTTAVPRRLAQLGWSREYGARALRRVVKREVQDALTARILEDPAPARYHLSQKSGRITIERRSLSSNYRFPVRRQAKTRNRHDREIGA